jgi:hypothetical protein
MPAAAAAASFAVKALSLALPAAGSRSGALTAAALLAATLAATLAAAPAVAALGTPLDRVDVSGLVLILLALHHGDCMFLMPMQGKQAVRFHRQPPDVVLVVSFKLFAQPGREPLQEEENKEAAGLLVIRAQLHHLRQEL